MDAVAKMKNVRDKLLLIDFFCHGTPSMYLWEKYINEHQVENIKKIDFRSKEFGWHKYAFRFEYKDGTTKADFENDMFYSMFFSNLCLNESCYSCKFKALSSVADIRVGDFWGEKYRENNQGVSCCVVFTETGRKTTQELSSACLLQKEEIEQVLEAQMKKSPEMKKERKRLLRALKGKRKLKTIYNTTLFWYRVKQKINSIFGGRR